MALANTKGKPRDFSKTTIQKLRERVAYMCSRPLCRRLTVKRASTGEGVVRQGKAAHICAASAGGPRYDEKMSDEECRSFGNGIWLCDLCSREIDDNDSLYPPDLLKGWKSDAEKYVEELVTHDSRLRQLRSMISHVLSTLRILSALPAGFDQTFEPSNGVGLTRELIEAEQILFENGFQDEANQVYSIRTELENFVYPAIRRLSTGEHLDISNWKNGAVRIIMIEIMRFSGESFGRYLTQEAEMVDSKRSELKNDMIVPLGLNSMAVNIEP